MRGPTRAWPPTARSKPRVVTPKAARQVSGVAIAGDFWALTGARAAAGRLFGPQEQDSMVIAWDAFERDFAADPHAVGSAVAVDGRSVTITGVLPEELPASVSDVVASHGTAACGSVLS